MTAVPVSISLGANHGSYPASPPNRNFMALGEVLGFASAMLGSVQLCPSAAGSGPGCRFGLGPERGRGERDEAGLTPNRAAAAGAR